MPIKIISGGLKEAPKMPMQTEVPSYSEESLLGTGLRNIIRPVGKGIENLVEMGLGGLGSLQQAMRTSQEKAAAESGTELPEYLKTPNYLPTMETIHEKVTKPIEEKIAPKGYFEPQNKAEEFLDYIGADLPFLAFGGGTLPVKIARSIGSSVGMFGAKEAGLGATGQLAGGLIGGGLPKLIAKGRPGAIRKYAEKLKEQNYAKAEPVAKRIYFSGEKAKQNLGGLLEEASDELDIKTKNKVFKELGKVYDEIPAEGNMSVAQIWKRKKQLNKILYKTDFKEDTLRNYYKRAIGNLNEFLAEAGEKYPEFGKPYQSAEKLHMAVKTKPEFLSLIKKDSELRKTLEKNKLAKMALSALGLFGAEVGGGLVGKIVGGTTGAVLGAGSVYVGKKGLDIYNLARTSPDINKYLMDLIENVSTKDRAGIASSIIRLNNSLQQEVEKSQPHVKIISGGLK